MLEQLQSLIRETGLSSVVQNRDVPDEHNEAVMQEAQHSILSGLQHMDMSQISQLIQQGGAAGSSEAATGMTSRFAGNIAEKFGINANIAQTIGASLIPSVLGKFFNKANDPNDNSLNLQDILGSLTGSTNSGNIQNTISSIGSKFGLDKDGDGDVDLNDITKIFGN